VWLSPETLASAAATSAVPVAVKLTGVIPATVAERVLAPAVWARFPLPRGATPDPLVVALAPVILPPPAVTAKATATPDTGTPPASVTRTEGSVPRTALTTAPLLLPPGPGGAVVIPGPRIVAVPLKVSGEPVRPVALA